MNTYIMGFATGMRDRTDPPCKQPKMKEKSHSPLIIPVWCKNPLLHAVVIPAWVKNHFPSCFLVPFLAKPGVQAESNYECEGRSEVGGMKESSSR